MAKSNDAMISPPDLGGPVAFIAPLVMSPTDSQLLYSASNYVFKSFDGGGQWYVAQGGNEIDGKCALLRHAPYRVY